MPPRRPPPAASTHAHTGNADQAPPCIRLQADGVVLDLSVSPGAKRTEVAGLHDGALRVRLAAQPVEGQANAALLRWLADELDTPRNTIELLRGDTSRRKQVRVTVPADQVVAWLKSKL